MSKNKDILYIKEDPDTITVKFTVKNGTYAIFAFTMLFFVFSIVYFRHLFQDLFYFIFVSVLFLYTVFDFIIKFYRSVIIDKNKNEIVYRTGIKTFIITDLISTENIVDDRSENTTYYLLVGMPEKSIKIKTQSYKQSQMLEDIIMSFLRNSE